jgi:hypothetical protein
LLFALRSLRLAVFLIAWEIIKASAPSGHEEKINRRVRGDRRAFYRERQKHKSFYGNGLLFAFRSSGDEDQRMSEEEAESAEIVP